MSLIADARTAASLQLATSLRASLGRFEFGQARCEAFDFVFEGMHSGQQLFDHGIELEMFNPGLAASS